MNTISFNNLGRPSFSIYFFSIEKLKNCFENQFLNKKYAVFNLCRACLNLNNVFLIKSYYNTKALKATGATNSHANSTVALVSKF